MGEGIRRGQGRKEFRYLDPTENKATKTPNHSVRQNIVCYRLKASYLRIREPHRGGRMGWSYVGGRKGELVLGREPRTVMRLTLILPPSQDSFRGDGHGKHID